MNSLSHYYLQQIGIEPWIVRSKDQSKKNLNQLCKEASVCSRCELHQSRTQAVFARGNPNASLMIIGEAPGFHEDKQGLPFVGKAGALLDKMLESIGLSEEDVYIANVVKCRPPNNRDPKSHEIKSCSDYLKQQIECVNPKLILAVGRFAGQYLVNQSLPLNKMRNQLHHFQGWPVLVSYHPAYLLRNAIDKRKAYQDLLQLKMHLNRSC